MQSHTKQEFRSKITVDSIEITLAVAGIKSNITLNGNRWADRSITGFEIFSTFPSISGIRIHYFIGDSYGPVVKHGKLVPGVETYFPEKLFINGTLIWDANQEGNK